MSDAINFTFFMSSLPCIFSNVIFSDVIFSGVIFSDVYQVILYINHTSASLFLDMRLLDRPDICQHITFSDIISAPLCSRYDEEI